MKSVKFCSTLAIAKASFWAVRSAFGQHFTKKKFQANSNIPISLGIPSVTLGRGGMGGNGH